MVANAVQRRPATMATSAAAPKGSSGSVAASKGSSKPVKKNGTAVKSEKGSSVVATGVLKAVKISASADGPTPIIEKGGRNLKNIGARC